MMARLRTHPPRPQPLSVLPVHRAVLQRKCARDGTSGPTGEKGNQFLQRKLLISASNDPLEDEADRIADQVLAGPARPAGNATPLRIQRFTGQPVDKMDAAPASVDRVLSGTGRPLEPPLRQDMEQRFGHDFSRVRVHSDGMADQSAQEVNANAYTVGHDIVFGADRFAPGTHEGRRLIAHELTHVAQQSSAEEIGANQSDEKRSLSPISRVQQEAPGPIVQRKDTDPKAEAEAQKALGERLWKDFPQGVNIAFYQESNDEAKRRAVDWAAREQALGLKNSKMTASDLVFGKAISDSHDLGPTLTGISGVLKAATATPPTGTTPVAGMGPEKVRALALFSHGTSDWCGLGPITTGNAAAKAKAMAPALATNVNILLLACNTGRGQSENEEWVKGTMEGGGADSLAAVMRDALLAEGIQYSTVWGHTTTGHVSQNFALREFFGASGKGAAGVSYVSYFIFPGTARDAAVADLQTAVTAKGYTIDDPKKFAAGANAALTNVMYFCYADAHSKFDVGGAKLGEAAPMHPNEVAEVVKKHWSDTYWPGQQNKTADALIKSLKLKKSVPASK
jgi:Domain of unknown function (DUF4157)